jgi:hypothetical protein
MTDIYRDPTIELQLLRQLLKREQELNANREAVPVQGGGSGGASGSMEARVAKVEASIEHIERDISEIKGDVRTLRDNARTDFRLLFGALITVALGLAGLMAHGFRWL